MIEKKRLLIENSNGRTVESARDRAGIGHVMKHERRFLRRADKRMGGRHDVMRVFGQARLRRPRRAAWTRSAVIMHLSERGRNFMYHAGTHVGVR